MKKPTSVQALRGLGCLRNLDDPSVLGARFLGISSGGMWLKVLVRQVKGGVEDSVEGRATVCAITLAANESIGFRYVMGQKPLIPPYACLGH